MDTQAYIDEALRNIKKDLHAMMNGVASAAMRDAGLTLDYRVNYGVELPRLETLAGELRVEHAGMLAPLAQQLWQQPVRECRFLALQLQPAEDFSSDLAEVWLEQIRTVELAQVASLYLFSRTSWAAEKAFQWMASEREVPQLCGYYTLMHVIRLHPLAPRALQEAADQAQAALADAHPQVQLAARRLLDRLG